MEDAKSEPEDIKMEHAEPENEPESEHMENHASEDTHRRGWFDIVMGSSNDHDSSDDDSFKKRKYSHM
jgi:hypothetical protein